MREREWETFIEDTVRGYISTALKYTKSFAEAEDIVWGVYGKLLEKDYLPSHLPTIGLKSVHNAGINHIKHQSYRRYLDLEGNHPTYHPPTEAHVDLAIILDNLSMTLAKQENVVFGSYMDGMTYKEMGVAHGLKSGTVKTHVHRSKKKLNKAYPEYSRHGS
jgi:RNA polymerase sigma factor (sigma-70 family)